MSTDRTEMLWAIKLSKTPKSVLMAGSVFCLGFPLWLPFSELFDLESRHPKLRKWMMIVGAVMEAFLLGPQFTSTLLSAFSFPDLGYLGTFAASIPVTIYFNLVCYALLYAMEYPSLMRKGFAETARDEVWAWEERIMGHKLWSGRNTYDLLDKLREDASRIGRAKWLLVNFLADDVDRKIKLRGNPVLYEISVAGWSLHAYSEFLADNMIHAQDSIEWAVDLDDVLAKLLPEHVVDVLISVGQIINENVRASVSQALSGTESNLAALLSASSAHCPLRNVCEWRSAAKPGRGICSECRWNSFAVGDKDWCERDILRYTMFNQSVGALAAARDTIAVEGSRTALVNGLRITFDDVRKKYEERIGGKVKLGASLPHLEKFRLATCRKKRYIYFGVADSEVLQSENRESKKATARSAIKAACNKVAPGGDYLNALIPKADDELMKELWGFLKKWEEDERAGRPRDASDATWLLLLKQPVIRDWFDAPNVNEFARELPVGFKRLLVGWAIDMFALSSGDENGDNGILRGVLAAKKPSEKHYPESNDIGFYDERLEISSMSSAETSGRNITWRVHKDAPTLRTVYFPEDKRAQLSYAEVRTVILDVAQHVADTVPASEGEAAPGVAAPGASQ